jgi:hypothetical protein
MGRPSKRARVLPGVDCSRKQPVRLQTIRAEGMNVSGLVPSVVPKAENAIQDPFFRIIDGAKL